MNAKKNLKLFFNLYKVLTKFEYMVVEVNLILVKLFHPTVTTYLYFNMHTFTISDLILNTFNFAIH